VDTHIAIPDPVYPVYLDSNVMAGRTGSFNHGRYEKIVYLESLPENNFVPPLPEKPVDLIYLCFPNNPTGATIAVDTLQTWVDFARENKAVILFDAAYESYIRDDKLPHSIYEIEGARDVAIEFRSFSKTAGFTGTRCAYTVVPKTCMAYAENGQKYSLHTLWNRRQTTKFNGVSYPVQKAAEAAYSAAGKTQVKKLIDYYLKNAALIRQEIKDLGYECVGGENSPYIWINCKINGWDFFDLLLKKAGVVTTPGPGFGRCGKDFIRISAFNTYENVKTAMGRIREVLNGS
jgi:LL-diaminopimelate aminotransferase